MMMKSRLQHHSVLMTNKPGINNQKALKHIWQLLESSASHAAFKELISWSLVGNLSQALYPLKERHLYRTVASGRLGAKKATSL